MWPVLWKGYITTFHNAPDGSCAFASRCSGGALDCFFSVYMENKVDNLIMFTCFQH